MGNLRAGVSKVDITPPLGVDLSGYVLRDKPSEGVHDNLYARALVLEDRGIGEKAVLVSADLLGLSGESVERIRREASEKTGIKPQNMIIACTHTHSGPATVNLRMLGEINRRYLEAAEQKIIDSIVQASKDMEDAKISAGRGFVKGVGYNRDRRAEGPLDEELGVIRIDNSEGEVQCLVLNYACHPVILGPRNLLVSADYPGVATRTVEERLAKCCIFTTGAAGDIDPLINWKAWGKGTFKDVEEVGRMIGDEAVRVAEGLRGVSEVRIGSLQKVLELPVEPPPTIEEARREVESAKEKLKALKLEGSEPGRIRIAEAMVQWAEDVLRHVEEGRFPRVNPVEITLIGINEILLVAVPGELFVEIGLKIKRRSPFRHTYVISYGNGLVGYFPTAESFKRGGYAPKEAPKYFGVTFLKPEAEHILEDGILTLTKELYDELWKRR